MCFCSGVCLFLPIFCETIAPSRSGATALGLDTGHTWGPLCAHGLVLAAPGPGWLADQPAGWPELLAVWLTGWLAEWLAGWLLGLSWTARLWDHFFSFSGSARF